MRKIVVGIALLLCAMAGFAADATTPEINAPANGSDWTKLSSTEKLFWSIGYSQGYADALGRSVASDRLHCEASRHAPGARRQRPKVTGFSSSPDSKVLLDPANAQVPIGNAIRIYSAGQPEKIRRRSRS
jgi:hypothetical protein